MKKLSIGQKAKAYDEAIGKLRGMMPNWKRLSYNGKTFLQDLVYIFPELKESEDERIRKALIQFFKEKDEEDFEEWVPKAKVLAWLEKNNMGISEATKKELEDNLNKALEKETPESLDKFLEKQGEQKSNTDFSDLRTWKYIVDAVWTEKEGIGQYLDSPFTEEVAKKLQKRFGNIEQKPAEWSEEDEYIIKCIQSDYRSKFGAGAITLSYYDKIIFWLKALKDRVQPQPKQEWSEKDESKIKGIINTLEGLYDNAASDTTKDLYRAKIDWLKSLRLQTTWKPSEEQLNALHWCVMNVGSTEHQVLQELLEQLEKLKDCSYESK